MASPGQPGSLQELARHVSIDLVFVFTNLRLVEKFKEPEEFAEWVSEIDEAEVKAMMQEGDDIFVQDVS